MRGRSGWGLAMGNRMCGSRRRPVEERLTKPQRLVRQPSDVDYKKLRKLILSRKLAPCFDALEVEDPRLGWDLEECPICFFYYPSLNRSRCCAKGICTECFLQMKPSDATRPVQCPFCKTPCYAVEYRGARTKEEKGLEQAEEQKVIEAKIRMQGESVNVEQFISTNHTWSSEVLSPIPNLGGQSRGPGDGGNIADPGAPLMRESIEADRSVPNTCSTRHEEFSVDLGEILMMEAIWQSLQDARVQKRTVDQTDGSSNTVGPESGAHESSNVESFSPPDNSETNQDRQRDSSDGIGSESECSALSLNSDSDRGCCGSIRIPSASNASNDDAGQSCSQVSDLIINTTQPFMLSTDSKALCLPRKMLARGES